MIDKNKVIGEVNDTLTLLESVVEKFDTTTFNQVPFADSWTPAQVVQHLILCNNGLGYVLQNDCQPTERAVDELIPGLRTDFLNFSIKMNAPEQVVPLAADYEQSILLGQLKSIKNEVLTAINHIDLTETCLAFKVPGAGLFTQYEVVYFIVFHTQRHIHQLQQMLQQHTFVND